MERLRYLDLTHCEIDWDFPTSLLSSLTHLKLCKLQIANTFRRLTGVDTIMVEGCAIEFLFDALELQPDPDARYATSSSSGMNQGRK